MSATQLSVAETFEFVAGMFDFVIDLSPVLVTGNMVEFDSSSQSTLSPTRSTLKVSDFCRPNVECPFDFVASVYGAKATRWTSSTFDKVHRVDLTLSPVCTGLY